jgi:serine/threonine protein kinase
MFTGIRIGRLTLKNITSFGHEARIWKVEDKFGEMFALKDYTNPDRHMRNELKIHVKLENHANILKPLDNAFRVTKHHSFRSKSPDPTALVYKYYCNGDLVDNYDLFQTYTIERFNRIMVGMWYGLSHCHKNGVCHRDIKPQNLLYDGEEDTVIICDFGMSQPSENMVAAGTSLYYSAPECYERRKHPPYNYKSDIWSGGLVYASMLWGPDILDTDRKTFNAKLRELGYLHLQKKYPDKWNKLSIESRNVLSAALIPIPNDRCEATDIINILA